MTSLRLKQNSNKAFPALTRPPFWLTISFSRLFDAGRVPVAVLRTIDRSEHSKLTDIAIS